MEPHFTRLLIEVMRVELFEAYFFRLFAAYVDVGTLRFWSGGHGTCLDKGQDRFAAAYPTLHRPASVCPVAPSCGLRGRNALWKLRVSEGARIRGGGREPRKGGRRIPHFSQVRGTLKMYDSWSWVHGMEHRFGMYPEVPSGSGRNLSVCWLCEVLWS